MSGEKEGATGVPRVERSDREWKERLEPEAYRVARRGKTEKPFTGRYWDEKRTGTYRCVCCGLPLFSSAEKFDSGTGWPSFSGVFDPQHVREEEDRSFFMRRTEVVCAACDAHLGHVFPDGPPPTGRRYCINSVTLDFAPDQEADSSAD